MVPRGSLWYVYPLGRCIACPPANVRETSRGIGEWILGNRKIPVSEYEKLAPPFNPVKFDATRVGGASRKIAGMKYIVITTKHHDGFGMLRRSSLTDWCMKSTPFATRSA